VETFLNAARQVTDKPIRFVVLTHWHPDHSLGIVCSKHPDLQLISHPENRKRLQETLPNLLPQFVESSKNETDRNLLSTCQPRLPALLVEDRLTVNLGGHVVEVFHPGAAHTQGDLVVWSQDEKVLATGDLFLRDSAPFMGEGSTLVWVEALEALAAKQPAHIIPGHFAVSKLGDMIVFKNYLQAQIDYARTALAGGVPLTKAAEAADFSRFASFQQYPQYEATFKDNARVVLNELAKSTSVQSEGEAKMQEQIKTEIIELHQFFDDWFTGRLKRTDEEFNRLTTALAPEFEMITPEGARVNRTDVLEQIQSAHAGRAQDGTFQIRVKNITSRLLGENMFVATYEEWQQAQGKTRGRISTVIFRRTDGAANGVEWVQLQETWLPLNIK